MRSGWCSAPSRSPASPCGRSASRTGADSNSCSAWLLKRRFSSRDGPEKRKLDAYQRVRRCAYCAAMINPDQTRRAVRADLFDRLSEARAATPGRAVFTTSFGLEDQAIAHAIFEGDYDIEVVT